jgi:hypothetical protein
LKANEGDLFRMLQAMGNKSAMNECEIIHFLSAPKAMHLIRYLLSMKYSAKHTITISIAE